MNKTRIYTSIVAAIICLSSFGQITEVRRIDNDLTASFKYMMEADAVLRYDSLAPAFNKKFILTLSDTLTFNNKLDSLLQLIHMVSSSDNQIRFYSWDDYTGGTWHNINCFAQYKTVKGNVSVIQLNTGEDMELGEYTDSGVYSVFEIRNGKTTMYLTFASGTHGAGHQHKIIQVFMIKGEKLIKCENCFETKGDLVLEYPRWEFVNLKFDHLTNQISFNEFKFDEEEGFYLPTGQIITLEFKNGIFTRKK